MWSRACALTRRRSSSVRQRGRGVVTGRWWVGGGPAGSWQMWGGSSTPTTRRSLRVRLRGSSAFRVQWGWGSWSAPWAIPRALPRPLLQPLSKRSGGQAPAPRRPGALVLQRRAAGPAARAERPPLSPPSAPAALEARRIRGAALDVFATEPLPPTSPLWRLPNVFMSPVRGAPRCVCLHAPRMPPAPRAGAPAPHDYDSACGPTLSAPAPRAPPHPLPPQVAPLHHPPRPHPPPQHCADRTKEFQFESLEFFVANVGRYMAGRPLLAVCDKRAGY